MHSITLYQLMTALGNAVFSSLWQMAILWLSLTTYIQFSPKLKPTQISTLSFAALLTGFIGFIATFFIALAQPVNSVSIWNTILGQKTIEEVFLIIAVTYAVFFILSSLKFIRGFREIILLRTRELTRVPGQLKLFTKDVSGYLGIKRKVSIKASYLATSPLTIGFIKPLILLPVALINQLSTQQLEAIILHELAHIKRNDYLINLINQSILTVLYFNPFAKWLYNIQMTEREKSADKWVLQFEYNNQMYASTLLQIAQTSFARSNYLYMPASGHNGQLSMRVKYIMGISTPIVPGIKKIVFSLALSMLVLWSGTSNHVQNAVSFSPQLGGLTFAAAPVFTNENSIEKNKQYQIQNIPVIVEKDKPLSKSAIYLKYYEKSNPQKTATTQHTSTDPAVQDRPVLFVAMPQDVIPVMDDQQEQHVFQSISTIKEIALEYNWKKIDKLLAESVTSDQKQLLKEQLRKIIESADWETQANSLRIAYDSIDWANADDQLKNILRELQSPSRNEVNQQYAKQSDSIINQNQEHKPRPTGKDSTEIKIITL